MTQQNYLRKNIMEKEGRETGLSSELTCAGAKCRTVRLKPGRLLWF